jgi:NAD(P)H-dependent FMN reductase
MNKIGIIVGSTRPERKSLEIAEWFKLKAEAMGLLDVEYTLIDLLSYPLPFFGELDINNAIKAFEDVIGECSGFVVVTPEYNHSITGVLKNALDFAYTEWANKPAGIISYGFGANGARAAEHLRGVMGALGVVDVKTHILISLFDDMKNNKMSFRDLHDSNMKAMLLDLKYWLDLKS